MNYMEGGSESKSGIMRLLKGVGKRVLTGESIFINHFTNKGSGEKRITFAAPYPGKIIPTDLATIDGGEQLGQK